MLLIEADGKELLAEAGIPVPLRVLVEDPAAPFDLPGNGPWMVKAQIAVGGRGKAGEIRRAETADEARLIVTRMIGTRIKGHEVRACLIEAVATGAERYLSVAIDPASYQLRVIYLGQGGVEVEEHAASEGGRGVLCDPDAGQIAAAAARLAVGELPEARAAIADTARRLGGLLIHRELLLAEINPLFLGRDATLAGDAKIVVDLSALPRQPRLAELVAARPGIYPDARLKLVDGFDYVVVDPEGEIGLVTTGAGLSMMLIDEMMQRGARPLNFCDLRTGQLRGNPERLVQVLGWIGAQPRVRAILVNIFAGITDLSEFADLLVRALEQSPQVRMPVVARLVGNGAAKAREIVAARRPDIVLEDRLEAALDRVAAALAVPPP